MVDELVAGLGAAATPTSARLQFRCPTPVHTSQGPPPRRHPAGSLPGRTRPDGGRYFVPESPPWPIPFIIIAIIAVQTMT